jgi:cystathionine gamma-lyase
LVFSSGLGANTAICHLLKAGDHVVAMDDLYGGTVRYFQRVMPGQGIEVSFVDLASHQTEHFIAALRPNTKMVWIETPTNPTLKLVDIEKMATIAKQTHPDVIVCVDNTFATPYFQKPLLLGADVVVHSLTKYINGHSDVVMGAAITSSDEIHEKLRFLQNAIGKFIFFILHCFLLCCK